jgi:hypothetical protein
MLFIHVFQCDRSLKSVVRLDQKHTTVTEWICHSLVRSRSNITREYQIHMFNHRIADISIEWWTRSVLRWQYNEWILKSIGFKRFLKAPIRVTVRNMLIPSISIKFCVSQSKENMHRFWRYCWVSRMRNEEKPLKFEYQKQKELNWPFKAYELFYVPPALTFRNYVFCLQCIYVLSVDLITSSDYFSTHK